MTAKNLGELWRSEDGQWHFRIIDPNTEVLVWGEAYHNKADAVKVMKRLNVAEADITETANRNSG